MTAPDPATPAGARALARLAGDKIGWLTTVNASGQPQSSPIWFLWLDDEIFFYSRRTARRNADLRERSTVAFNLNTDVTGDEVGGVSPAQVTVPEPELLELGAIRRVEKREVAAQLVGLDEPGLELGQCRSERVRETGEARGGAEPVQGRLRDGCADDQLALSVGRDREIRASGAGDLLEEVVEGPDPAREQGAARRQQLTLDALDVRPVRHDQDGISVERAQVALEEQGDFARVRGPSKQRQPAARGHRPIVDLRSDGLEWLVRK